MSRAHRRALVVLGTHRGGGATAARLFSLLGAVAATGTANHREDGDAPRESPALVGANNALLADLGTRWDGILPLAPAALEARDAARERDRLATLIEQEYGSAELFVVEDPRISRLAGLWSSALRQAGAEPAFALVFRDPLAVASSLEAEDGLSPARAQMLWLRHLLEAEHATRGERRVVVSYEALTGDWSAAAERVASGLGLDWPRRLEEASAGVERLIAAERGESSAAFEGSAGGADIVGWVKDLHGALEAAERGEEGLSQLVDAISLELGRADLALGPVVQETAERADRSETTVRELTAQLAASRTELEERDRRAANERGQSSEEARQARLRARALEGELDAVTRPRSLGRPRRSAQPRPFQLARWLLPPSRTRLSRLRTYVRLRRARVFDAEYYLARNPELAERGVDPLMHYVEHGWRGEQDPNAWFSGSWYLAEHRDVARAQLNPLAHYVQHGRRTERTTRAPEPPAAPSSGPPAPREAPTPRPVAPEPVTAELLSAARERLASAPMSVSVVVPAYNQASTLARALRSALAQLHAPVEIVVSDDGSTDEPERIVEREFGAELREGRVRVLRNPHRGVSAARNAGLEVARGDVVAYLDSDNEWDPSYLLLMVDALARHPEAATAYAGIQVKGDPRGDFERLAAFDRMRLLRTNYIDMNVFVHRRWVAEQLGGFDEELARLVDWDLILRYTRLYPPVVVPHLLAIYHTGAWGETISSREALEDKRAHVLRKHSHELAWRGLEPLRIGYVLWDWPALSQTWVLEELRGLLARGCDVKVYFRTDPDVAAQLDFSIDAVRVSGPEELAERLRRDGRTILHSHFAYPAATKLTFPAAVRTGIPFTLMPHAVDIFNYANEARNEIDTVTRHPLCRKVIVLGEFHREYLIERGVPAEKLTLMKQAMRDWTAGVDLSGPHARRLRGPRRVISTLARFIEKKGVEDLIRAAHLLSDADVEVRIYGWGPLEDRYRALIDELGLANVRLAGTLEGPEAVRAAFAETDVLALPCTRAENGDMDGLPTVLLEAMALGVPVVTTAVSGIPGVVRDRVSGVIVADRDPEALAAGLRDLLEMPAKRLRRLVANAERTVRDLVGVDRAVDTLLDLWARPPIDIVLVTYSREDADGPLETREILRRIADMTTTPFEVTVVDNASDPELVAELRAFAEGRDDVRVLALPQNRFWGPAVNLALGHGSGEHVIYVCSNEGFVAKVAWEQECLHFMRSRPRVGLAGHLISSPSFHDGDGYRRQPWFARFRNRSFAKENGRRPFQHVQGGIFVLRRAAYEESGGYNEAVAQGGADIEYSYFLESRGWELGDIERLPSVTTATRPRVGALIDEDTIACHPLSRATVPELDRVVAMEGRRCNVCGWTGHRFAEDGDANACPQCASTPFSRAAYRFLAGSNIVHRGRACAALLDTEALRPELSRMFALERHVVANGSGPTGLAEGLAADGPTGLDVLIAGPLALAAGEEEAIAREVAGLLGEDGIALLGLASDVSFAHGDPIERLRAALAHHALGLEEVGYPSRVTGLESTELLSVTRLGERSFGRSAKEARRRGPRPEAAPAPGERGAAALPRR